MDKPENVESNETGPRGERIEASHEPIPRSELLAYGSGVAAFDMAINGMKTLAGPIFNITLGMSTTLVGHALVIMRMWDAFTDPLMGWLSDNTKSRWGRRRPYVFLGSALCAVAYALIFHVPNGLSPNGSLFTYFVLGSVGLYTCVTVLSVSYNALGFEMSPDYHERTVIFAYRAAFAQLSKVLLLYLYFFCQLDVFVDTMTGVRWVGLGLGILIFLLAMPSVLFVREGHAEKAAKQEKIPIGWAIKTTMKTQPFLVLAGLVIVAIFGSNFHLALGPYVNIYHVAAGDTKFGAELQGIGGVVGTATAFASIPLLTWFSMRFGKIRTVNICLWFILIGSILKWFTYTPSMPYLQLVVQPFLRIGETGFWLLIGSMKADVCDWDEWKTGYRREGMYGAAAGWVQKLTQSLTFAFGSGYVLSIIGFDATKGAVQDPGVVEWMRILFAGLPSILAVGGIFLLKTYPIDEEKAAEISRDLEEQRA